jgi:hypothetical protein
MIRSMSYSRYFRMPTPTAVAAGIDLDTMPGDRGDGDGVDAYQPAGADHQVGPQHPPPGGRAERAVGEQQQQQRGKHYRRYPQQSQQHRDRAERQRAVPGSSRCRGRSRTFPGRLRAGDADWYIYGSLLLRNSYTHFFIAVTAAGQRRRLKERLRELGIMFARAAAYCDDGQFRARGGIVPGPNT